MNIGTKSLLYGAHQFALHPLFVALAWRRLYGSWPSDLCIWLAFLVHDWGYWGCPNMDGEEGKLHPWWAALWFAHLFGGGGLRARWKRRAWTLNARRAFSKESPNLVARIHLGKRGKFCLLHSRSLARRYDLPVSDLCAPDKIAAFLMPRCLYLTLTRWTGELEEYMAEADTPAGREQGVSIESAEAWFDSVKAILDVVAERIVAGGDPGTPPTRHEELHDPSP